MVEVKDILKESSKEECLVSFMNAELDLVDIAMQVMIEDVGKTSLHPIAMEYTIDLARGIQAKIRTRIATTVASSFED